MRQACRVAVRRWHAWLPGIQGEAECGDWAAGRRLPVDDAAADASPVPAMVRRRLGTIGRSVAAVAWDMIQAGDSQSLIFASRHGDQSKTLQLLAEIGAQAPLSPAAFSLSVHNALAGLISIARDARGPHTALSADERLMASAITEAFGQLHAGASSAVCVVYDLPLPADYQFDDNQKTPYAIALELTLDDGEPLSLSLGAAPGDRPPEPEALSWLRWWAARDSAELAFQDGQGAWQWQRG